MKGFPIEILGGSEERSFHLLCQMRYRLSWGRREGRQNPALQCYGTPLLTFLTLRAEAEEDKDLDEKHSSLKIFISLEKGPRLHPNFSRTTSRIKPQDSKEVFQISQNLYGEEQSFIP